MKIIDNLEQNSEEWFLARSGKITGSVFHTLIGNGETRNSLIYKLAYEQINKRPMEEERYENEHMRRGHELEPLARDMYRIKTGEDVKEVGFVLGEDEEYTGCSPDGLVGQYGLLEIKAPIISTMIKQIIEDKIKKEYYTQIQYNLFISKRDWCDYVMYNENLPLYIKRIEVDNKFVEETIIPNIERAKKDILEAQDKLLNYVNNNIYR